MATIFFNAENVYTKNKNLRRDNAIALIEWVKNQPHLPDINEAQAILFLHRWNFQMEAAKTAVDTYFTVKTHCPEIFLKKDPFASHFRDCFDSLFCTVLSQKSIKGYTVVLSKIMKPDNDFSVPGLVKILDMVLSLNMYEKGPSLGHLFVYDVKDFELKLIPKFDVHTMRAALYYVQKAVPLKFKQWHLINPGPYIDQVVALMKPFMEKELADEFYVHQRLAEFYEHVSPSSLPKEYGGSEETLVDLHGATGKKILENVPLFDWENGQIVDENKRHNKSTDVIDYLKRGSIRNGKFEID